MTNGGPEQGDETKLQLSRRAILGAGAVGGISLFLGSEILTGTRAFAAAGDLATAQYDADRSVGFHANDGPWVGWGTVPLFWCAYFASWLLRGTPDFFYNASSTALYDHYYALGRVGTTPRAGALSIYSNNGARSGIKHTGWVRDVTNGLHLIEGNTDGDPTIVKSYSSHWTYNGTSFWRYLYPTYVGYDSLTGVGDPGGTSQSIGRHNVTTRFYKIGTGDADAGPGTLIALAGDLGYPGPGNWQEYVRPALGGNAQMDRAKWEYLAHGQGVWIPAAQWDALKRSYTEWPPTVGIPQTVSLSSEDRALLLDIAAKLEVQQP